MSDLRGPLRDEPPEGWEWWVAKVAVPLSLGKGVACFFAVDPEDGGRTCMAVQYDSNEPQRLSPDARERVRSLVRYQVDARAATAMTWGYLPEVD